MNTTDNGKIKSFEIQNFTCFENVAFECSVGINIFIGENGTGKTHALKLLYAISSKIEDERSAWQKYKNAAVVENNDDRFKLTDYFKPDYMLKVDRFFRNKLDPRIYIKSDIYGSKHSTTYGYSSTVTHISIGDSVFLDTSKSAIFIPSHEMLSIFEGFISAYENREIPYDLTQYHLVKKLGALPLRGDARAEAENLLTDFSNLDIDIHQKGGQFFIHEQNREIEAMIAAEGVKKMAQMIYLIRNGALTKNSILFWDEPEVNLNPKYIRLVADFLMTLARQGVQIFVATHDYLLTQYLSNHAEYRPLTNAPPMQFCSFYKTENGTTIETAETVGQLEHNVLLDEYAALYDLEGKFFEQSLKV